MLEKKSQPIKGLGLKNKLTVQKSIPLFALWKSELTLQEFKILDTYLSRINSHKPENRTVVFDKGEMEKIFGVDRIRSEELKKRLKNLTENVVKIPDTGEKEGYRLVTLFEEAKAEKDEYGVWKVKLEATQKATKYFFNIENLGYLRYKLRCITDIKSRYTYIMFNYLEYNRFRKSWEVSFNDLKSILKCDEDKAYEHFGRFNDLILKKVKKELDEKTECKFTYEPIKRGRYIYKLKISIGSLNKNILENIEPNETKHPIVWNCKPNSEHLRICLDENPKALKLLLFIFDHMDKYNAVMCSYRVINENLNMSSATIERCVKYLKDNGFVYVYKSGVSNVYVANDNLVWNSWGNNRQYCKFPANIILAKSEQNKFSSKSHPVNTHDEK